MKSTAHTRMRIWHRYLGFFLAGIMAVYSTSGVLMIFRDTDLLKRDVQYQKQVTKHLSAADLAKAIRQREIQFTNATSDSVYSFKTGTYNANSGDVVFTVRSWPAALEKMTQLHKASSKSPLFFLNVFFGFSLFFFVLSSFWMFMPQTSIFKKGLYFTLAGVVLTIIMLLF